MNIIGLFGPKIVSFLFILFSPIPMQNKAILLAIWLLKLIIDYSTAKPGRKGVVYKLVKNVEFEMGELIVNCIQFIPSVMFVVVAIRMQAWIALIPGIIGAGLHTVLMIACIKDVVVESRRGKKNAGTNCK